MGREKEKATGTMGKKRALEPEGQVEDGRLNDFLVDKVLDQLDLSSIAAKLAPELAARVVGSVQLEALSERVLEKLASTLANNPAVVEAVASQLLARLA